MLEQGEVSATERQHRRQDESHEADLSAGKPIPRARRRRPSAALVSILTLTFRCCGIVFKTAITKCTSNSENKRIFSAARSILCSFNRRTTHLRDLLIRPEHHIRDFGLVPHGKRYVHGCGDDLNDEHVDQAKPSLLRLDSFRC